MVAKKWFKYDGTIKCLSKNLNEADMAFYFDVEYKGKREGKDPDINGKATALYVSDLEGGLHKVPVGSTLWQDTSGQWHIKK